MPSYLDLALIAVVLVSAFLSMVRGFTREVLAIFSWVAAAAAAYYFHPMLVPAFVDNIGFFKSKPDYAKYASATAIFFGALIVVSLITVKISDMILDSKIGALDRSLGFLFGAGRGYLLCVIAFIFFAWLVPPTKQPDGVRQAKSRVVLENTGEWLQALLPQDMDSYLSQILKKRPKGGEQEPSDAPPPGQRSDRGSPEVTGSVRSQNSYQKSDRTDMKQLFDATRR